MKNHVHKPDEGKAKVRPLKKTSSQVTHPILQLQQLVGNKAVTKMLQRHPNDVASGIRSMFIESNKVFIADLSSKQFNLSNKIDSIEGQMKSHAQGGGHLV